MGLRSLRSSIAFAVLATLLTFGFQNCGKTLPGFGHIGSPHENPGNGSGYEGMGPVTGGINFPQLRYVLTGTCSDGKNVFSAIVAQGDVFYLQIDACQAQAAPLLIPPSEIQLSGDTLTYRGQVYKRVD